MGDGGWKTLVRGQAMTPAQAAGLSADSTKAGVSLIWTIYDNPIDFPGHFIARPYDMNMGCAYQVHMAARTLDGLRAMVPPGLVRLPRDPRDDRCIVEVWL